MWVNEANKQKAPRVQIKTLRTFRKLGELSVETSLKDATESGSLEAKDFCTVLYMT